MPSETSEITFDEIRILSEGPEITAEGTGIPFEGFAFQNFEDIKIPFEGSEIPCKGHFELSKWLDRYF